MKIQITFKDPDAVGDAVRIAVDESLRTITLDEEERDLLGEKREEKVLNTISQWIKYSEYVTIEIDTDANSARVMEAVKIKWPNRYM